MHSIFLIALIFSQNVFFFENEVHCDIEYEQIPKPCQVILPCSDERKTVFATEGWNCYIFANGCKLRNENCQRHNVYFKTLMPVPWQECQKHCEISCDEPGVQLCLEDDGELFTKQSYCEWNLYMCKVGKYIPLIHIGPCFQNSLDDYYD